eukprot:gene21079-27962_t
MASNLLPQHEDICVNVTYDHRIDDPVAYVVEENPSTVFEASNFAKNESLGRKVTMVAHQRRIHNKG